ncbi:MAG: DNA replication initiation control protein YabA [Lactobacillus sp.]|nr:DNA replication initiation control protein YabA [Lactobacillus sp.]
MDPYTKLQEIREAMTQLSSTMATLEGDLLNTLKENTELKVENQLLREKLNKLEQNSKVKKVNRGFESLNKIYQSGYHICNTYYGSHRDPNSDCIFCLQILDNMDNRKA